MKVAVFTGLRKIEIVDQPEPRIAHPMDVKVRIHQFGICGSDLHYFVEGGIGPSKLTYPATLGHECAGEVVAIGDAVTSVKVGDRIALEPSIACGHCDQCRVGREHTCRNNMFMGSPGQAPGAAAEYRILPAANCFPLPDSLSYDAAVMSEPGAIALYGLVSSRICVNHRVAILGCGPIGLSVLLCLRAMGHRKVYMTDVLEYRKQLAASLGASWTGSPNESDVVSQITAMEPTGLDYVMECSGDPACIDQAAELLTPGGTLVQYGIHSEESVSFDPHLMRRKELVFHNVRRQRRSVEAILDMMARGQVDSTPLVTHHLPMSNIQHGFEMLEDYSDGVVKVMVSIP